MTDLETRCGNYLNVMTPADVRILPIYNSQNKIDFTSNDYLGLSKHPDVTQAVITAAKEFGIGATGSRLLSGNTATHYYIEQKIAALKKMPAALVFGGGFHTNSSVLQAILTLPFTDSPPILLMDKYIHACWINGGRGHKIMRYRHQVIEHLSDLVKKYHDHYTPIVVTESIFSMDGDVTDLNALARIKQQYPKTILIIDEAHATGIVGENGAGCVLPQHGIDIVTGTFSKALGSYGGYVACGNNVRDFLINRCGGLIYATALPIPVLAAINAALDLLPQLNADRQHLICLSKYARKALKNNGFCVGDSQSQIIPIIIGDNNKCLNIKNKLYEKGILVAAIRPPTVPTARLRLSLQSTHSYEDIDKLAELIKQVVE